MDVAVVHDGTITPGGAVRVVVEATAACDGDLFVGFSGEAESWWAERVPNDVTVLRRTRRSGRLNDLRTVRSMLNLDLREYDVVLTSGPAAKFFQPYDDQSHVHYLHHPPLAALWFTGGMFDYLVKTVDRVETQSLFKMIANSDLTATRARRQYNRAVDRVVPPPVDVESFRTDRDRVDGQLVMVGRLEERKRPLVAVRAMKQLSEYRLSVVGDGPMREELVSAAPENVEFLGYVDDQTLRRTVEESVAGLFLARREDFGITPVEYMAAGTPVVGVDEPNTNNQVDGASGVLVDPTPDAVAAGVRSVARTEWDRSTVRQRAEQYGTERFRSEIVEFVEDVSF